MLLFVRLAETCYVSYVRYLCLSRIRLLSFAIMSVTTYIMYRTE